MSPAIFSRVYARRATAQLARQSPPALVRVLALPGLGVNGTVGDFIDMRHPRELRAIGDEIADLAELTPEYWQARLEQGRCRRIAGPVVPTPLTEVAALPETKWLWSGRLAMGRLNLVQGLAFLSMRTSAAISSPRCARTSTPSVMPFVAGMMFCRDVAWRLGDAPSPVPASSSIAAVLGAPNGPHVGDAGNLEIYR